MLFYKIKLQKLSQLEKQLAFPEMKQVCKMFHFAQTWPTYKQSLLRSVVKKCNAENNCGILKLINVVKKQNNFETTLRHLLTICFTIRSTSKTVLTDRWIDSIFMIKSAS